MPPAIHPPCPAKCHRHRVLRDSVGDGITDAWRIAHFGGNGTTTNSFSCATCDPDHDGLNNRQEFLSGTDPNNAASALRAGTVASNGKDINVNFATVQGIVYRVEFRPQLSGGGWLSCSPIKLSAPAPIFKSPIPVRPRCPPALLSCGCAAVEAAQHLFPGARHSCRFNVRTSVAPDISMAACASYIEAA